jgi:hypothetical protein
MLLCKILIKGCIKDSQKTPQDFCIKDSQKTQVTQKGRLGMLLLYVVCKTRIKDFLYVRLV